MQIFPAPVADTGPNATDSAFEPVLKEIELLHFKRSMGTRRVRLMFPTCQGYERKSWMPSKLSCLVREWH